MTETELTNVLSSNMQSSSTFTLLVSIASIVFMWFVFKKAGREGWEAVIPIYNVIVLFKICKISPYVLLWLLLPIIGWIIYIVYYIIAQFKLAKAFGKSGAFGLGLWLVQPVFLAIIAFDKSINYVGLD